jgi:hypothetical protein
MDMAKTIDKSIKHGNHLPGTERYTRPEEIKALAKFLKEGISEKNKDVDILQDNLEVPQDGRPGKPMYKEVQELSRTRETIYGEPVEVEELGRGRIDLTKNPDPELETGRLGIQGNEDLEELGDTKLQIQGNEDKDLSEKRLDISPEEINSLGDLRLSITGNKDLDNLSEKKLQIQGNEDLEELGDTRLNIKSADIENLEKTRLDIEAPEEIGLENKRLDISTSSKNINLSKEQVKIGGKIREPELETESLQIKKNEVKELSDEVVSLNGKKEPSLSEELARVPKSSVVEPKELSKEVLWIEDKPKEELSDKVERISPKEVKELEDTRLDLEKKDVKLSDEVLKIEENEIKELPGEALQIKENGVEALSEFKDELEDKRTNSLSTIRENIKDKPVERLSEVLETIEEKEIGSLSKVLETIEKRADPELSEKVIRVRGKNIDNLSEEVLRIKGNEEVELGDTRLDIQEKEVGLPDHLETISPPAVDELSNHRDDLSDSREVQLENGRLEIEDRGDISLPDHLETISPSAVDELSDKRLEIEGKDVELSDTRLDISPEDTDLPDTRIDLQTPEDQELSDIRLDISSEDKELSDIRIDLQKPRDQDLSDTRLDIEEKEVGLSDVLLDLLEDNGEWDKKRLESAEIGDPENSLKKLTDIYEITGLSDVRLDISNEDVELSDIVIKEPHELDIPLSDIVVKEPEEKEVPLSDIVVKEPKEKDIPLSDIVIKEPSEKEVPLSDIVIKEPHELDIPLSDIVVKEPEEKEVSLSDIVIKEPEEKEVPLSDIVVKEPEELDIPLSDKVIKEPSEKEVSLSDLIVKEPSEKEVPLSGILKEIDNDKSGEPTETQFGLYSGTTAENLDWLNLSPEDKNKLSEVKKLLGDFGEWGQKIDTYLTSIISGTVGQYVPETKVEAYKNIFRVIQSNEAVETPAYRLGEFNLSGGGLSVSKYLRWTVENTVGRIPLGGSLKTKLIEETLRLLIEARDLAEKETESRPFRLPGNSLLGTAAGKASKGITVGGVLGAIGNLASDAKMKPYNRPSTKESTEELDTKRDKWVAPGQIVKDNESDQDELPSKGSFLDRVSSNAKDYHLGGDPSVSNVETRSWEDMLSIPSQVPNADGLVKFGMEVSRQYLLSRGASSAETFDEFSANVPKSYRLTTPDKFTSTSYNRNYMTLDSNHVWEVIIRPFLGIENNYRTWLPSIAEIDLENKKAFNITTHYSNGWLPVTGYELQSKKLTSKELQLHSGNIHFPVGMEMINELRLTFADDSLKSVRRYFELASKVSAYMSNIHTTAGWGDVNSLKKGEEDMIDKAKDDPTVVIEGRIAPAHYKNVSFLIDIYSMTPQLATIYRTQLLCVLKDFVFEGQGETDASPTELAINFSVVGEWPKNFDLSEKLSDKEISIAGSNSRSDNSGNSILNNIGGVLSSF